jgi:predicted nucleic acid-binding protein
MRVIVNTTVISNFASIGQLDVLRQLYGSLAMSPDVYDEIQAGVEEGYHFYAGIEQWVQPLAEGGWIHLASLSHEQELRYFRELPTRLHRGEMSSLAIARHRGWLLLTDDRAARTEATRLGVLVSGSLGCLVFAIERHLCSLAQANSWLQEMMRQGYRSPVTDLTPLLKRE